MPVLKTMKAKPVLWNGMLDTLAEGLEHSMKWLKNRFKHCNKLRILGSYPVAAGYERIPTLP